MASGKWITELSADMPLAEAARRILDVRLGVVRDRIKPAITKPETDIEHVHQLRVATRRAAAALELLESSMSPKSHRLITKRLRRIRRACGPARDCDVFLENIAKRKKKAAADLSPGFAFLQGLGHAQRADAYEDLKKDGAQKWFDAKSLIADALDAISDDESKGTTFGDASKSVVAALTRNLELAAAQKPDDFEHLHEVRIHAKQLRYAMELFSCCFPAAFRERYYSAIEDLQEILGLMNDSYVTAPRLESLVESVSLMMPDDWKRLQPGIEGYLQFHRQQLVAQQALFVEWWNRWTNTGLSSGFWFLLDTSRAG